MLFYLDNVQSVAPGTDPRALAANQGRGGRGIRVQPVIGRGGRGVLFPPPRAGQYPPIMGNDSATMAQRQKALANAPRGLNENYGRELMELHTLGVDGGYTQRDVIDVAKILTGWGIDRKDAKYQYRDAAHDFEQKIVMGEKYPAGHGEDEGMKLLRQLATAPATMHHVSAQLCQRLVADEAPDGCIDDAVRAWERSNGEIRQVVRAIVHSPDFWAPVNVQSKVKTPLEFVVTAVRAVSGIPDSTPRLAQNVARLGEPLFQKQTPDGYGEKQEDWVNSGALLARMNFAVQLASGRMPGVTVRSRQGGAAHPTIMRRCHRQGEPGATSPGPCPSTPRVTIRQGTGRTVGGSAAGAGARGGIGTGRSRIPTAVTAGVII